MLDERWENPAHKLVGHNFFCGAELFLAQIVGELLIEKSLLEIDWLGISDGSLHELMLEPRVGLQIEY
jgi:hypothetical protein